MDSEGDQGFPTIAESHGGPARSRSGHDLACFAHAPLAVMVVDASGRYIEVNRAACRLTGYEEAELLAMSVADIVAEESRDAGLQHFARVKEAGRASGEFAVIRKDGSKRWITCDAVKLAEDRFMAFKLDTTDRRNAEEALRRSQSELRAIYDHNPVMMCVIDADRQVLYCNRALSLFVGKPEEELKGDRACGILGCINALDDPRGCGYGSNCASCSLRKAILDTFQTGASHAGIDYRATVEGAGDRRKMVFSASTSLIQHGGQARLLLCLNDITERIRAEEAIRESELRFRTLAEKSPAGVYLTDTEGKCLYVNPRWCDMAGLTREEAIGDGWVQGLHPEDRANIRANWYRMATSGGNWGWEYRFQTRDGRTTWVWGTAAPLRDEHGTTRGYIGTNLDITERKQAEERIRLLAELLDASPASTTVHDAQGNFLYANEKTFSLHGLSREEFFQLNLHQLDVPESEGLIEPRLREIAEKGGASFEVHHYRKDGTTVPLRVDAKPARWGDQEVFLSVASDVSAQKRTEHALREREARLRGILDAASESVFLIDREGIVLECNETTARRLGKTVEGLLGKSIYSLLPPDLAQSRRAEVQKVVESREPVQFEDQRAGVWFEHTVYPVFDDAGAVAQLAIFGRDVSERRENQETLLLQSLVLDQIQDRVTVTDLQGVITYVNDAECLSLKRSRESLIGQSVLTYGDDPNRGATQLDIIRTTLADGEWRGEVINYASDGSEIVMDCRTSLVKDDRGQPLAMCGIGTDITQRKQAEESLRQSEEHYRVLAETMLQGVVHQDRDGTIISMNPAAERILGKNRGQFLGSSSVKEEAFTIREDGSPFPGTEHPAMVALRTGQPLRGVVMGVFNPKVHAHRWINVDAVPLFRPGEEHPYQVYTVFEDITERKQAAQQMLEMERRLLHAQKLESLGILAGGIAHDFNNILAGIMGYADLLKVRLPPSEPAREDVEVIKKAVQRAADLTRQMLAYSGKGKFVVEPVDLSRIVADTRKMLEVSVSKKATLSYNLASGLPAMEADPAQVHQVVLNLVINASEALGEDSGVIAITTHAVQLSETQWAAVRTGSEAGAGHYVCLEIADTGCGMSRETLGKIFDPFYSTKFTGRGLGLAAVHGIVRGHKGGLRVVSEPGEGTTFQVFFPASVVAAPASEVEAGTASRPGSGTVLVVDDEEIVRNTAKRMIEHAGFSVLTANDGEEAIRVYRQHRSEVVCVILDLTMPKLNGEETLRGLRAINPGICAILSSGFSEDNATERFSDLGLGGFIQKPYRLDTMTNTLRRALASSGKEISASGDADTMSVSTPPSSSTPHALARSQPEGGLPRREGGTVLLVDDDAMCRTSTQILFEQAGFSVLTARDGEEAVQVFKAQREQIVCVFLDLNLPGMNGEETLRAIRQMDRRVHAIVTSGCTADTMKRRLAGVEVLEFIQKPDPLDTAIERLQEAVRTRLDSV